jgi:hypothetical protein
MNYLKHYCNLIRKAENRTPPEGYTEKHHTFPKSIFGDNNRIVVLTVREHYISHLLLQKVFIQRYGISNLKSIKMINAVWWMSNNSKYTNSYLYEKLRICVSEMYSGENNPSKRDDVREKLRNITLSLGDNHHMKKEENRKKQSERMKLNPPSKKPEVREKIKQRMFGNKINLGRKHTEDTKQKYKEQRCKTTYRLVSPDGEIIITRFLSDISTKYNLDHSSLLKVTKGKLKHYKGWKVEIVMENL